MPTRCHFPRPTRRLTAASVAVAVATGLLVTAAPPRDRPSAVEANGADVEQGSASEVVPSFRPNDPLAIEAFFPRESYRPAHTAATLRFESTLGPGRLQIFHPGPEWGKTVGDMNMRGVPVTRSVPLGPIQSGGCTRVTIGHWPTGLYFAQLTAKGGRVGYAPFVVPPRRLGRAGSRSYCRREPGRRTTSATTTVTGSETPGTPPGPHGSGSPAVREPRRPPHFRNYDLHFLHWLQQRASVSTSLPGGARGATGGARAGVRRALLPGHHEYVTERVRHTSRASATAGAASCLSANNFFWRIDLDAAVMTRVARGASWAAQATLLGVQFVTTTAASPGPWLPRMLPATGCSSGASAPARTAALHAGIEIDHTSPARPRHTGHRGDPGPPRAGLTAHMTYYETARGARVFSAGAFSLAGAIRQRRCRPLENIWERMTVAAHGTHHHRP